MSASVDRPDSDAVNPYASPQGLEDRARLDPNRVLTATFVVDEAWLRETASSLTRRQDIALHVTMIMTVVACIVGATLQTDSINRTGSIVVGLFVGLFAGAFCGLAVGLSLAWVLGLYNRFTKQSQLSPGICQLRIDSRSLVMTCAGKRLEYPLQEVGYGWDGSGPVYFRIRSADIAFKIAKSADFGDDDFTSWKLELKNRIKR